MGLRVDQIEEAIAARIVDVDADPYDQRVGPGMAAPAFTEAASALVPAGESRGLAHLRFWVLAAGAPVRADRQAPGTDAKVVSRVDVQFLYRIRPTQGSAGIPYQRVDQRLAARAAAAIVRAVKARPQDQWAATVIDAWRPSISDDAEWLLVTVQFSVLYEMPV